MIQTYSRVLLRWREKSARRSRIGLSRVTIIQWALASVSVVIAAFSYEVRSYALLALLTQLLVFLSFVSLIIVTREVFKTSSIGKFCLVAGVFVFYWIDALSLSLQPYPFAVPPGFPYNATQFDQTLIQQALFYVSVFQLLLLVGYSIRPRLDQPLKFLAARVDSLSFDRTLVAFLFIMCSFAPLVIYYDFDIVKIVGALLASRSGTDFESPEPGLAQHVALFGIYGASLGFVYALKAATWRRIWWLILAVIAALPFVLSGTRHVWLYISLPSVLIVLRGFKGRLSHRRIVGLSTIVLIVLVVAQAQFVYRGIGWTGAKEVSTEDVSQINTNGQLTALLFAEYLVPDQHSYFKELAETFFLIHWVPRQIWPNKPIMESWAYYNESYVQGANFNVTPSIIGQFHLNWGLPGVMFIGAWLGFLTFMADQLLLLLDSGRQRAMFVVLGMFYAFIISSFRIYSPVYFSYFCFGLVAMFLLTRRRVTAPALALSPQRMPA